MYKDKLNPKACNTLANVLGVVNPRSEAYYRASLELIDTNLGLSMFLQLSAFGLFGFEVVKIKKQIFSKRIRGQ